MAISVSHQPDYGVLQVDSIQVQGPKIHCEWVVTELPKEMIGFGFSMSSDPRCCVEWAVPAPVPGD